MYTRLAFLTFVIVLFGGAESQRCSDCMKYVDCAEALELATYNRNDETLQLFNQASCGSDTKSRPPIPKVCCSYFAPNIENTNEDTRINNHRNQKLLPADCGVIKGDRIVGGKKADLYEFPWMALISHKTRDGTVFKCGGSIINSRYILTAAHCVKDKKLAGVRVGEYDINNEYDCQNGVCEHHIQDIRVSEPIVHEDYRGLPRVINDIALLRLEKEIDFKHRNIDAICLPKTSQLRQRALSNKMLTVAGWGLTENGTDSSVLLKVTIPIHTAESCSKFYNRYSKPGYPDATANQLCAGTLNMDSCNGDSGGPLMFEEKYNDVFRYVQYGVVSHGPQKCGSNYPGVYTDVTKFMGWVLDHMKP